MSIEKLKHLLEKNGASLCLIDEIVSKLSSIDHISEEETLYNDDTEFDRTTLISKNRVIQDRFGSIQTTIDRYNILECLGQGGMGVVHRAYDSLLRRHVAMKMMHSDLLQHESILSRFMEEAQVIAQLQHPNIIPIYDFGKTVEGKFYYTMIEVKGFRLDQLIKKVHRAIHNQTWVKTNDGWTFHRLISVFLHICEAIAFAHENGVLHRDLKPDNVMIGSFGAVFVMDWGIAKVIGGEDQAAIDTARSTQKKYQTRFGEVTGTPAYMSPEQARGENKDLCERSDIYALGAILHEILLGSAPYTGKHILQQIRRQQPTILQRYLEKQWAENPTSKSRAQNLPPLPTELVSACQKALSYLPEERFSSASELALLIREWLEGSKKREQALQIVDEALKKEDEIVALEKQAMQLQQESSQLLKHVSPWEQEEKKQDAWHKEDQAQQLLEKAELLETEKEQRLQAALIHKSDLQEAHLALAEYYRIQHEKQASTVEQKKFALRVLQHAQALPSQHIGRKKLFAYLKGGGALSLKTQPGKAEVWIQSYQVQNRRLVLDNPKRLGLTPLSKVALAMGSYRLTLRKPGFRDVYYPVSIAREEHWSGMIGNKDVPIWLPTNNHLTDDVCYVPAGWYWSGGDSELATSLPKRRIWIDGFFMQRFPVRLGDYITFLNALIDAGKKDEALRFAPKERDSTTLLLDWENGYFSTDRQKYNEPIHSIDWFSAHKYTVWYSQRTNTHWRLPTELEWEKSARGVDGRYFPWGHSADPSWACMRDSHVGRRQVASVDLYPVDESPYGIRGLGGNVMDWTSSIYHKNGPEIKNGRMVSRQHTLQPDSELVYKGGSWYFGARFMRSADRHAISAQHRGNLIGFRMVCSSSVLQTNKR